MTVKQPIGRRAMDLTGCVFGRWTVMTHAGKRNGSVYWLCVCDCGNQKDVMGAELRRGNSQSCGCLCAEIVSKATIARNTTHGRSNKGPYVIWRRMLTRCLNSAPKDFKNYGGRGITVCARWQGRDGFTNFEADMGRRPVGHSIERQRNEGNYEPGNCVWASRAAQNRNKRTNVWVTIGDKTLCFRDACKAVAVHPVSAYKFKAKHRLSAQATIDHYIRSEVNAREDAETEKEELAAMPDTGPTFEASLPEMFA